MNEQISPASRSASGPTSDRSLSGSVGVFDIEQTSSRVAYGNDSQLPVNEIRAWPRLDAPAYVPAQKPFDVVVGFGENQQAGVTGGKITLLVPADATFVDITVELIADGVDALDAWSKPLRVPVENSTSAQVTFRLTGRNPTGPEPVHLTMLEVRYVLQGTVCGTASRPLVIGQQTAVDPPISESLGVPWLAQPVAASAINLKVDELVPDLTIELFKPDRNAATGHYICRLYSPYDITAYQGPHHVDLGADAKSFAKEIVDDIRNVGSLLIDNMLISIGSLVAQQLPPAVLDALREIAQKVAPKPPAVLIVSADPYVPWELAMIDPPLDASLPPYLGAQAIVGRWLREAGTSPDRISVPLPSAAPVSIHMEKPPLQPPTHIDVRNMAVMGGFYGPNSGLRNLPKAEEEAKKLAQDPSAIPLAASPVEVKQLLDNDFTPGVSVGAVHFAGHGDFNPTSPDSSVLFLNDGTPLKSILFRSAKYGGEHQPLIFLNACMVGIGGELLGNMGGFPGNCLSGGFGGMLGALWEVDDTVAHDFAIEFWQRALPTNGENPEPIGAILRDLRAKYNANSDAPVTTYLAYVYYGHPRLTLHRIPL